VKKDLRYYMELPYTIEVVAIPESEGGGFTARLPQVGRFAITGDGDTPAEAIANLEKIKKNRFEEYLKKGVKIPEPESEKEDYSGRFVLRLPKILHRQLAEAAKRNESSLNQYVVYLLTANLQLNLQERFMETLRTDWETIFKERLHSWIKENMKPGNLQTDLQGERLAEFTSVLEKYLETSDEDSATAPFQAWLDRDKATWKVSSYSFSVGKEVSESPRKKQRRTEKQPTSPKLRLVA
jgi:predicted HicB family RNase H-like nuclease